MTLKELYLQGKTILTQAGIESPAFDTICLFQHCTGNDRQGLIINGSNTAAGEEADYFLSCIEKRAKNIPLQYILGEWEFMGYSFYVGDGVLIPREDTAVSVEKAIACLQNTPNPKILDLCSGSGAIAITLAKEIPQSRVFALELSPIAFNYLEKNIKVNNAENVTAIMGDVLSPLNLDANSFDLIISNPPYIKSDEISTLQKEVQQEPAMALDGGYDGYKFYREIINLHTRLLKPKGNIVFEVGEGQCKTVMEMLNSNGYTNIGYLLDWGNIERTVFATKK